MLVVGGAAVAVAAAVAISNLGGDSAELVLPPVAEQRPAYLIVQDSIDAAIAERNRGDVAVPSDRPAAQIVQDEIDSALADLNAVLSVVGDRPAYLIIQDEIDSAMAERNSSPSESNGE